MTRVDIHEVHVRYRTPDRGVVRAVNGVDLTVESGTVHGLVGESGCGKSSLARAIAGLIAPSAGRITLDGVPVVPLGWHRRPQALTSLQMIFQDPGGSLNPRRTIGSQIADGLTGEDRRGGRRQVIQALLERVQMPARSIDRYPHEFSGGQRQRLAIARALAARPRVLIADEPVTALDASAQAQVISVLMSLVKDLGVAMLFISHDLALVHEIADRTAVMYLGRVVESGETRRLLAAPRHPYTQALVDAIPQITGRSRIPATLPGEVPDPANIPPGCPFRPRCRYATGACGTLPPLRELGGRLVACHRAEQITLAGYRDAADAADLP